jgi:transposase InsO family protein
MKSVRLDYPLGLLCRVFGVSRSGFYAALERQPSQRAQDDERLKIAIKAAHVQTRETYGPLRLQSELVSQGFNAGRDRIVRLRRELGLRCKQNASSRPRRIRITASQWRRTCWSRPSPARPNEAWVSDITYVPTDEGWLYLAGIKDVFTCEMVGYEMGARMTQGLTAQALWRAVRSKRPAPGLILHSDRGSQYCADDYRKLVAQFGMRHPCRARGTATTTPHGELLGQFEERDDSSSEVRYTGQRRSGDQGVHRDFYNRQRRHSRLGYVSPASFAESFRKQALAA